MSRSRSTRLVLVLLVLAAVTTPSAWGAPLRLDNRSSFDILTRAWESFVAIWNKARCGIDPHGLCVFTPPPTQEAGCTLDPHGACIEVEGNSPASQLDTEARCGLDPHGGCIP